MPANSKTNTIISAQKMEKLLTIEEVAEALDVSKSTVKAWASRRLSPVVKMGRLIRITPQTLQEWIRRNTEFDREEARKFWRYKAQRAQKPQSFEELSRDMDE